MTTAASPGWEAFRQGCRIQGRVILALMLRELRTQHGRLRIGYLWALAEPILFVAVLYAIYALLGRSTASGMPLVLFLVTGLAPFQMFRDQVQAGLSAVDMNRSLLWFPQIAPIDFVVARALLNFATHILVFVILLVLAHVFISPVSMSITGSPPCW